MNFIQNYLGSRSMHIIVLQMLGLVVGTSFVLSFLHGIDYSALNLLISLVVILFSAMTTHAVLSYAYKAPANIQSSAITALILFCIITPSIRSIHDALWTMFIGALAVATKYVVEYRNRHIWNPVALALVISGLMSFGGNIWWVGTPLMFPVLVIALLAIAKKIERFDLVFTFIIASLVIKSISIVLTHGDIRSTLTAFVLSGPIVFFAAFMLTEPLSTPPTRTERLNYAVLTAFLVSFVYKNFHLTPEMALVISNIYSYAMSNKVRMHLFLKEKKLLGKDTYEFVFEKPLGLTFKSGQYMDWILPHSNPDDRGIKRMFTIASSPNDSDLRLGVKMYENGSTYKNHLRTLVEGQAEMYAIHPVGDFTLEKRKTNNVVLIAGGIGVTPFISMIRNKNAYKDVNMTLIYANKTYEEICYIDLLRESGIKVVYMLDTIENKPESFVCEQGFITEDVLLRNKIDIHDTDVYISGPHRMVESYTSLGMKYNAKKIHTDFFPGYV